VRLSTVVLLLLAVGCSAPTAPTVVGQWGGPVASLVLAPAGGTLSYQCGSGTVDSTWTLSANGRFVGTGQHFIGGGPVPAQGRPPHPALYVGQVDGDYLTLTVTLTDLNQTLGPFRLARGGAPVAEVCV
jgi:hypothetical protein